MSSSSRKRNMLEAFQASAREAAEATEPAAEAGGPFAEGTATREEDAAGLFDDVDAEEGVPDVGWTQILGTAPLTKLLVVQLLLLVFAFWLGYLAGTAPVEAASPNSDGTGGDQRVAQEPTRPSNQGGSNARPSGGGPKTDGVDGKTPYDRAFFDVANSVTLRVASYAKNSRNTKLAWDTYDYLFAEGMPVVTPVSRTQSIFIFVGATRSVEDLEPIKERVQALPGPSGGKPFADAYAVNIDDYHKR